MAGRGVVEDKETKATQDSAAEDAMDDTLGGDVLKEEEEGPKDGLEINPWAEEPDTNPHAHTADEKAKAEESEDLINL